MLLRRHVGVRYEYTCFDVARGVVVRAQALLALPAVVPTTAPGWQARGSGGAGCARGGGGNKVSGDLFQLL
jgi:hypothetical protein